MSPLKFDNTDKKAISSKPTPMVYFREVNRIHANRFKAYAQILSNRLNADWQVTTDVKSANVVIEPESRENPKGMKVSVLADTANLKPTVLWSFNLAFDEDKLVKQLNTASKHLLKGFQGDWHETSEHKHIMVCGLLNESLSSFCDILNQKKPHIKFEPCMRVFSSHNDLYRDQLLLIVDPKHQDSVRAYQSLYKKKSTGQIIINELTIAIIQQDDEQTNEKVFDFIYGNADGSTQVTLINPADERDLDNFVKFF